MVDINCLNDFIELLGVNINPPLGCPEENMITCAFENGGKTSLRHVVLHAIVEDKGKLLLVKRVAGMLEGGKWALPGGFLDRDEDLEQGVLRELEEETGWQGKIIVLFRINSQPDRPHEDRQNVAFEFIIKPIKQITKADQEVTRVEWIDVGELPPLDELAFDHGETIRLYLGYKKQPLNLPIIE